MTIIVTGGAGFIGSNFVLHWFQHKQERVINLDALTYAGNLHNLDSVMNDMRHHFIQGDISDTRLVSQLLKKHAPRAIINFAAETHVDRSIHGPADFIQTNVNGTFNLLECARTYFQELPEDQKSEFRFVHVSTDEVYGSLKAKDPAFTEDSPYQPNSPYSASKAASDHLVRAYYHTYGLPVITTNCSNNYGPYQFPEKLIPLMIHRALSGDVLPVYGDGENVRDWLYVIDHCTAIEAVMEHGRLGEVYAVGGNNEMKNIDVVNMICDTLDEMTPRTDGQSYRQQISFVTDRPGHDRRYAMNTKKISTELGWQPAETFATGLRSTIEWYLHNADWLKNVTNGNYRNWMKQNYS